jgi:chorismate-pyruvate lyase
MVKLWNALIPILAALPAGASAADSVSSADNARAWPDAFVARLEALALLQTLNAELLSHDSATQVLEQWCGAHRMASPPRIVATPMRAAPRAPSEAQRRELRVGATELVRYRHVELACGTRVLSRAENWYVPGRLSPEMNRTLETSDVPFGAVVRSLHFRRHTLSARLLFSPLPAAWELAPAQAAAQAPQLVVPGEVLEHRAVLALPDGTPISEVVETYSGELLAFGTAPPVQR